MDILLEYWFGGITKMNKKPERLVSIKGKIFEPYLAHVEFELNNIITQLQNDKELRNLLDTYGYNIRSILTPLEITISKINQLQGILKLIYK